LYRIIDEAGELIRWNDRVPEVSGYTHDEIDDMDVMELFAEEDVDTVFTLLSEMVGV
jgi:PAS domain S-box-containing protein